MIALLAILGCGTEGCLDGATDCRVEPACNGVLFVCPFERPTLTRVDEPLAPNNHSSAATGDWVLDNGRVRVTISDLDHPHYLAPTGGNLLDIQTWDDDGQLRADDSLRNIYQVGGLLPTEAVAYASIEGWVEEDRAVVQVKGTYDDDPDVQVYTRYELRACDPGVRIRTELVNRHPEPESVFLADVHYIGGRGALAFAPGVGFDHPPFGLSTLEDGLIDVPWVATAAQEPPGTALGWAACNEDSVTALLSEELTAVGLPPILLPADDHLVYERFLTVGSGESVADAADLAVAVRNQLAPSPVVTVPVHVDDQGLPGGRPHGVVVRGDVPLGQTQVDALTHVALDGDTSFTVPPGGPYTLLVERFGIPWHRQTFMANGALDLDVVLPPPGRVELDVTVDGRADHAVVMVWPSDDFTRRATTGSYLGHFEPCAPQLGHPHGRQPSCNRVLVDGPTELVLPPGRYDFATSAGPFSTAVRLDDVTVTASTAGVTPPTLSFPLATLDVVPSGALSGDFHVHGSASFDSSSPDTDRVRAFLASRLDVIVATDHDRLNDYADALAELDGTGRLEVLVGLETTGHILQPLLPSERNPKVVGHWIAWPFTYDPTAPWRGAPWDEKAQPGELFTRFEDAGWPAETGVIQLNHPWGGTQFGRDYAWPTALELDLNEPLVGDEVPEGHALFGATPPGARFANDAYHAQEVMNGTDNLQLQQYRALWHYLLNQGVVRAGTANSDSHTLGENLMGYPRNLVFDAQPGATFDPVAFDAAVRAGRMVGTSGPVLAARLRNASGLHPFGIDQIHAPGGTLDIDLASASWIPVEELRVVVNGETVHTVPLGLVPDPANPFAGRQSLSLPLDGLLPAGRDAWLSLEVGAPLPEVADLDCDGMPDTGDNNRDGRIDWQDVEAYAGRPAPEATAAGCLDEVGPLRRLVAEQLPGTVYEALVPGGLPFAFTNPWLFDGDGDGAFTGVQR